MKRTAWLLMIWFIMAAVVGCGAKEDVPVILETTETPKPTATPTPAPPTPEPTDLLFGKGLNPLTGLYIDEEAAARRPIVVVINNLRQALPQSGIGQADLYYEVLAEGGITRLISVFQEFDAEKIGPIRSARHYFLDFALDQDGIFVHHGGSQEAGVANTYTAIQKLSINNLDGMRLDGTYFWRDPERYAQPRMREHSSYTSMENIMGALEKAGYRKEKEAEFKPPYTFYPEPASPKGGEPAVRITVPFSGTQKSVFEYDSSQGVYKRFQNDAPHIDGETGEQLTVTNVLVQLANVYSISGDVAGRQDVVLIGEGGGYLATNGVVVPITWKKEDHHTPTEWYDAEGEPILLNQGKTWICVFQKNGQLLFEGPEEKEVKNTENAENGENRKNGS